MKNKILIIVLSFSFLQFSNVLSADLKRKRRGSPIVLFGPGGLSETIKKLQDALPKAQKAQQDGNKDDLEKYLRDAKNQMSQLLAIDQVEIAQKIKNTKHFREFLAQHDLLDKSFLDTDKAVNDVEAKFKKLQKTLDDLLRARAPMPEPVTQLVLFGQGSLSETIKNMEYFLSKAENVKNKIGSELSFKRYKKNIEIYMKDFLNLVHKPIFEYKIKNTAHFRQFLIQHNLMTNEFLNSNDDKSIQNFMFQMKAIADRLNRLEKPAQPGPAAQPKPVQPRPAQPQLN